jgi:hypothetical protein
VSTTIVLTASFVALLACTGLLMWRLAEQRSWSVAGVPGVDARGVDRLLSEPLTSDLGHQTVRLADVDAREAVIFVFTPGDCSVCLEELASLESIKELHPDVATYAVLSHSNEDEAWQLRGAYGFTYPMLLDPDGEILDALHLPKTPWKLLVDLPQRRAIYQEPPNVTEVERQAFLSRLTTLGSL